MNGSKKIEKEGIKKIIRIYKEINKVEIRKKKNFNMITNGILLTPL